MTAFETENDELFQESVRNHLINGLIEKPITTIKLLYEIHKHIRQLLEANHNDNHGSLLSF